LAIGGRHRLGDTGGIVAKQTLTLIRDLFVRLETETEFDLAVCCHGARGVPSHSKYLVMDNASNHKGPAVVAPNVVRMFVLAGAQKMRARVLDGQGQTRKGGTRSPESCARAPQLAEGAVTQVRAGSLQQQQRQQKQQRDQLARCRNARRGPGGGARKADQAVRSAWLRSRVLDRLADVQPSNVTAFYRKCAWGNVVEDSRGDFFDISSSAVFFFFFIFDKKKKKKKSRKHFFFNSGSGV
jgi:hypothetical protein